MVIKYQIFKYQELWVSRKTIFLSNLVTVHQGLEEQCQKVSDDHSVHTEISFQLELKFLEVLKNVFIYFWLHWIFAVQGLSLVGASGATLPCGAQASHCGGFSCCRAQALGLKGFSSLVYRLSCSLPRGIFLNTEHVFPALAGRFLTTAPPGKSKFLEVELPLPSLKGLYQFLA